MTASIGEDTEIDAPPALVSFGPALTAAVVGASGGIGRALADELAACPTVSNIVRLSRSPPARRDDSALHLDLEDETSIAEAAGQIERTHGALHLVIIATGILHDAGGLQPERSWRALDAAAMERVFRVNTIGPALVAKHFLPLLAKKRKSAFAALSARVGSIEDNRLGGWHAYRSSKAALNMLIKTLSVELAHRNPEALCVGLHPGTVDSALSKPFQANIAAERIFSPQRAARQLLNVLDRLSVSDTGHVYAWDGSRIPS